MFPRGHATSEHGDPRFPRRATSPPNLSFELGIFPSQPVAQTASVTYVRYIYVYVEHDRKIYYEVKPENVMRLWREKNNPNVKMF